MSEAVKKDDQQNQTKPEVSISDLNNLYNRIKSDNEELKKDNDELKLKLEKIQKALPEPKENNDDAFKEVQAATSIKKSETPTTIINEVKKDNKKRIDTTKITNGVFTG